MASLHAILVTLSRNAHNPSIVGPVVSAIQSEEADVVIGQSVDQLIAGALAEHPTVKATDEEKAAAKCSANARSLALAILATAATKVPDVRAISGWSTLLKCSTRSELAAHVDACLHSLEAHCGDGGANADRRGGNGLLGKGKVKAPTAQQASWRLLRDAWGACEAHAAFDCPKLSAQQIAATARPMPVSAKGRTAA